MLEIPSIPNPFPELCCSPFASVLSASLLPKATSRKKQVRFIFDKALGSTNTSIFLKVYINCVCLGEGWSFTYTSLVLWGGSTECETDTERLNLGAL